MEQDDERLWVIANNGDRGLLVGNSHTHPGRFLVLWESSGQAYSTSLSDLADMSAEAKVWLDGFLHGNEPSVFEVLGLADDVDPTDEHHDLWRQKLRVFRASGTIRLPTRFADGSVES